MMDRYRYMFRETPPLPCSSAINILRERGESLTKRYTDFANCEGHGCREIISYAILTNPTLRVLMGDGALDEQIEAILNKWEVE